MPFFLSVYHIYIVARQIFQTGLGFWSIGTAIILCVYGCVLLLLLLCFTFNKDRLIVRLGSGLKSLSLSIKVQSVSLSPSVSGALAAAVSKHRT